MSRDELIAQALREMQEQQKGMAEAPAPVDLLADGEGPPSVDQWKVG